MKIRFLILILSFLLALTPCVKATVDYWSSSKFETLAIPPEWKDKAKKIKIKDYEYVSDWNYKQLELDRFLSELGLPDRYIRNRKDNTLYMIYDFNGHHTFVVYLFAEKNQRCAAAALFGPDGKNIKLIK